MKTVLRTSNAAIALATLLAWGSAGAGTIEDNIRSSAAATPSNLRANCARGVRSYAPVSPQARITSAATTEIPVGLLYKTAKIALGSQQPDLPLCPS
jgi:hypothetical protein